MSMNWKYVFNPFLKFDEKKLLVTGLMGTLATIFVSFYTKQQTDSIFHFSLNENLTLLSAFQYCIISYTAAILLLFVLAKIFNRHARFIDIVNTVLLSQVFNAIILFAGSFIVTDKPDPNQLQPAELIKMLVNVIFTLPFIIIGIIYYYNGFKTATNMKKWQQTVLFAVISFLFIAFFQIFTQQIKL